MSTKMRTASALAAITILAGLSTSREARGQVRSTTTTGSLGLGESGGAPKGYAFLLPVCPATSGVHEVAVDLRAENPEQPANQWNWYVTQSIAQIKGALTFKWYGQAACPDDLTSLQAVTPGGTLTQNPLANPIWGYFNAQSFTVDTIKDVCTDWAQANACDPFDPGEGCPVYTTFDLVGGVAPASSADTLKLKASCSSGPLPTQNYGVKLRLRCNRIQ
jgi:hypothetical protein